MLRARPERPPPLPPLPNHLRPVRFLRSSPVSCPRELRDERRGSAVGFRTPARCRLAVAPSGVRPRAQRSCASSPRTRRLRPVQRSAATFVPALSRRQRQALSVPCFAACPCPPRGRPGESRRVSGFQPIFLLRQSWTAGAGEGRALDFGPARRLPCRNGRACTARAPRPPFSSPRRRQPAPLPNRPARPDPRHFRSRL